MSTAKPRIVIQDVLELLKKGYTRYEKDNRGYGSIQAHYGLSGVAVKRLFLNEKLKQRKTILPKEDFELVDMDKVAEGEVEAVTELLEKLEGSAQITEPVLSETKEDVVGLEQAKVVLEELSRLEKEEAKSGVSEEVKDSISKDGLFN